MLGRVGIALSAAGLLVSLGLITYSVAMRYLFGRPVPWVDETVAYMVVAIVMLAGADALRQGEHIAIDILTERLGARGQRFVAMAGLVAVIAVGAIFVREGWEMVAFSLLVGQVSMGRLATPLWIPQIFIVIGGVMLGLTAFALLARMAFGGRASDEVAEDQPVFTKKTGLE